MRPAANLTIDSMISAELLKLRQDYLKCAGRLPEIAARERIADES